MRRGITLHDRSTPLPLHPTGLVLIQLLFILNEYCSNQFWQIHFVAQTLPLISVKKYLLSIQEHIVQIKKMTKDSFVQIESIEKRTGMFFNIIFKAFRSLIIKTDCAFTVTCSECSQNF